MLILSLILKLIGSAFIVLTLFALIAIGITVVAAAVLVGLQLAASDFFLDGFKWLKNKFKRT